MDVDEYTKEYLAQYQGRGPGWFEQVLVAARRRRVIRSLENHAHRSVLEVGCGLEPLFSHWQDYERFTVVEPSRAFVDSARSAIPDRRDVHVSLGFLEAKLEELHARAPFDFIVVSSLLHEVADPDALLSAIRSLCVSETVIHFNVPNVRSLHRLLALEMGLISDVFEASETEKRFQRTTRFDAASFRDRLQRGGFDIVDSGTYFLKPFTHGQMEKLLDSGIIPVGILRALETVVTHFPEYGAEMFADVRARK